MNEVAELLKLARAARQTGRGGSRNTLDQLMACAVAVFELLYSYAPSAEATATALTAVLNTNHVTTAQHIVPWNFFDAAIAAAEGPARDG